MRTYFYVFILTLLSSNISWSADRLPEGSGASVVKKKREQVKDACSRCRKKHSKCNPWEDRPCPECIRHGLEEECLKDSGKIDEEKAARKEARKAARKAAKEARNRGDLGNITVNNYGPQYYGYSGQAYPYHQVPNDQYQQGNSQHSGYHYLPTNYNHGQYEGTYDQHQGQVYPYDYQAQEQNYNRYPRNEDGSDFLDYQVTNYDLAHKTVTAGSRTGLDCPPGKMDVNFICCPPGKMDMNFICSPHTTEMDIDDTEDNAHDVDNKNDWFWNSLDQKDRH